MRVADTNPLHLGHQHRADGRWRVYVFADAATPSALIDVGRLDGRLAGLPGARRRRPTATTSTPSRRQGRLPAAARRRRRRGRAASSSCPRIGPFGLVDYEKVFATHPDEDIFELRGVDRAGCVVVVRPDQYVAAVLPLDATDELAAFFRQHLLVRGRQPVA